MATPRGDDMHRHTGIEEKRLMGPIDGITISSGQPSTSMIAS